MRSIYLCLSAAAVLGFATVAHAYVFSSISQPGAASSNGLGINNAGMAAGSSSFLTPTVDSAWVWNGTHTNFRFNNGATDLRTNHNGIADDGSTVGFYDSGANRVGFVRTSAGVLTTLPFAPSSTNTTPLDINSSGDIVGTISPSATNAGNASAFLYRNGAFVVSDFVFNGSTRTQFNSINNAGQIVGRWRDTSNNFQGLIYDATTNTATSYSLPGATQTHLFGVNDLGQIVGYYSSASFTGTRGFLLSNALDSNPVNDSFVDISYAGPGIVGTGGSRAYSINDDGTIVGTYNGFSQAYIAVVPEPASFTLLAGAGVLATLRRR
jgi:hypothetical protein